jgi:alkylation response protein AidB-like acyl-CoA dehydrogenase
VDNWSPDVTAPPVLDVLEEIIASVVEPAAADVDTTGSFPRAALSALDLAMRIGAGAAFRKDVGIERHFRDARASAVMAPTLDALQDFIGRALCGLPLFG